MQEENNAVNSPNLDGQGRRSVVDQLKTTSPFDVLSLVALGMAVSMVSMLMLALNMENQI